MITGSRRSTTSRAGSSGPRQSKRSPSSSSRFGKPMAADDHHLVAVELLDGWQPVGHHLAQLREDQIEDLL